MGHYDSDYDSDYERRNKKHLQMGHYDSDYERRNKHHLQEYKKQVEKAKAALIQLSHTMPVQAPQRIQDHIDAINDWLVVQAGRQG